MEKERVGSFGPDNLNARAAQAIDQDGTKLLELIQPRPFTQPEPPPFETRTPPTITVHVDSSGPRVSAYADQMGRIVGRFFVKDHQEYGLRGTDYRALRLLVEKVLRARPFKTGVSSEFIETEIFKWCRARLCGESEINLSEWLLGRCKEEVRRRQLAVPLAFVEVEAAFGLGNVVVAPLDPIVFDRADESFARNHPNATAPSREARARMREQFANRTVVLVELVGEERYADQKAREIATDIAVVLRFLSAAAISHDVTCLCHPLGVEHVPRTTVLRLRDAYELVSSTTELAPFGFWDWKLTSAYLEKHASILQNLAAYFEEKPLTELQKRVWSALTIYSEAVATSDRARRLMLAMSSAELILLGGQNEGIQASVGDRMAFALAKDGQERRAIVANFKRAYQLRSRHVHHAKSVDDDEVLATFFVNMFRLMVAVIANTSRFRDHSAFLGAIERIKYGG
jgi:hypothetical protein